MTAMKTKRAPLRIRAEDVSAEGLFSGYGSLFGVVDSYGDVVAPGAFSDSLALHEAEGTSVKMLWQHEPSAPIGVWTSMTEDAKGLKCEGRLILDVELAREALALLRASALDGLSIGFDPVETEFAKPEDYEAKYGAFPDGAAPKQLRVLKAVDLWEVSLVTFPACRPATVETVKRRPWRGPSSGDFARLARAVERRERLIERLASRA